MQVHKVTLLIIDLERLGAKNVQDVIVNARYSNRCIRPDVMKIETRDVEWSEDHPLNNSDTYLKTYLELFPDTPQGESNTDE